MPDYHTPLAAAGGAAGGGFLGSLGRLLEPLDYARQALWNIPGKLAEGDVLGALPGLLGAGAGGALALSGVGAPLAILGGSLLGGLGQGIGKGVDEERFQAPEAHHLTEAMGIDPESVGGMAASFGLGALSDPLTYAGLGGGGQAGARAGRHLENVALTRGPRYGGGAEKLLFGARPGHNAALIDALGQHLPAEKQMGLESFARRLGAMGEHPEAARLLGELPPGSTPLGIGAEALAFRTPEGGVVRIAGGPGAKDVRTDAWNNFTPPAATIKAPEVLQPARDIPIGPYRVQHVPFAEGPTTPFSQWRPEWQEMMEAEPHLHNALTNRGLVPEDLHLANIGKTSDGRYLVRDPGSVLLPGNAAPPEPITQAKGGRVSNFLLDMLGADRSVQREIARGTSSGGAGQGLYLPEVAQAAERARAQAPSNLVRARASRDTAWESLLNAQEGQHSSSAINDLVTHFQGLEGNVREAKMAMGLPIGSVGTPLQPLSMDAALLALQRGGAGIPHPLDYAEVARRRLANADIATGR